MQLSQPILQSKQGLYPTLTFATQKPLDFEYISLKTSILPVLQSY